jgi:hypothetical protein
MAHLRLRQICLAARELEPRVAELSDIFGLAVCHRDGNVGKYGLANALLPIGASFLEVVAPTRDGTAAGRYLERRDGDGGYMVILDCDDIERRRRRMETVGVRIANALRYETGFSFIRATPAAPCSNSITLPAARASTAPIIPPARIGTERCGTTSRRRC